MTNVSLFRNVRNTTPVSDATMDELLESIRSGRYRGVVEGVRSAELDDLLRDLKLRLPAATFSGRFSSRSSANLISHSGLVTLDFDDIDDSTAYKEKLKKDDHVYAALSFTEWRWPEGACACGAHPTK